MPRDPVLTTKEWIKLLKGRIPEENSAQCTLLLQKYRITPPSDTQGRYQILDKIDSICITYLESFGANRREAPLLVPMTTLGLIARRHKKTIIKSKNSWNKIRSAFGPSTGGGGKMLVNRNAGLDTPSARGNYWLERADPKHRSWGHQGPELFEEWYRSSSSLSFWDWLESTGKGNYEGVKYLDPEERWRYWIVFDDSRKLNIYDEKSKKFVLFNTKNHRTAFSGRGFAIYVCSPSGICYSGSHEVSRFHHSSFLAGKSVMCAGEWVVSNGTILLITHKTGHYQATPQNLLKMLYHLKMRTDISKTIVCETKYAQGSMTNTYVNAYDWLNVGGQTQRCSKVKIGNVRNAATQLAKLGATWDQNFGYDEYINA